MSWGELQCTHYGNCKHEPTMATCNKECRFFLQKFNFEPLRQPVGFEIPDNGTDDGKTAHNGKDYPVHSSGPWSVSAGIAPDPKGRLIVEDCHGNPVCATSARGVQGRVPIMEANAKLIAAAPEMLEVLRWLDDEMDCRDNEYGGVLFSRGDFEKVRLAIKLAMEG